MAKQISGFPAAGRSRALPVLFVATAIAVTAQFGYWWLARRVDAKWSMPLWLALVTSARLVVIALTAIRARLAHPAPRNGLVGLAAFLVALATIIMAVTDAGFLVGAFTTRALLNVLTHVGDHQAGNPAEFIPPAIVAVIALIADLTAYVSARIWRRNLASPPPYATAPAPPHVVPGIPPAGPYGTPRTPGAAPGVPYAGPAAPYGMPVTPYRAPEPPKGAPATPYSGAGLPAPAPHMPTSGQESPDAKPGSH